MPHTFTALFKKIMHLLQEILSIEQALIGNVIYHPDSFLQLSVEIQPALFQEPFHQVIIQTMFEIDQSGSAMDVHILKQRLRNKACSEIEIGYINQLPDELLDDERKEVYVFILKEAFERKQFELLGKQLIAHSYDYATPIDELYKETEKTLSSLATLKNQSYIKRMSTLMNGWVKDFLKPDENCVTWFSPTMNNKLGAMIPGEMLVVGGRPGMGKSAFMLSQALHAAIECKQAVLFVSMELSADAVMKRLLAQLGKLSLSKIIKNEAFNETDNQTLAASYDRLKEAPIYLLDNSRLSVFELRSIFKQYKLSHDIKLIMVDYLQLVQTSKRFSTREQEISMITKTLKLIARELKIPILVSSQLSRSAERRGINATPLLSDLREGGSIEQDADKVMFLYRPEYYALDEFEDGRSTRGKAELIIAKNRTGPLDIIRMNFRTEYLLFEEDYSYETKYGKPEFEVPASRMNEFDN
jgi:replicative DNA helicase